MVASRDVINEMLESGALGTAGDADVQNWRLQELRSEQEAVSRPIVALCPDDELASGASSSNREQVLAGQRAEYVAQQVEVAAKTAEIEALLGS